MIKLPEMFSKYFIGQAYLAPLTQNKALNCPISNVTFEPGCRNNWHSHTGGQILVVISGKGYYQARGEAARLLLPGDVVEIPANVEHWHGAAPDSWFSHLAIECNPETNKNTWLEPWMTSSTWKQPPPVTQIPNIYPPPQNGIWKNHIGKHGCKGRSHGPGFSRDIGKLCFRWSIPIRETGYENPYYGDVSFQHCITNTNQLPARCWKEPCG